MIVDGLQMALLLLGMMAIVAIYFRIKLRNIIKENTNNKKQLTATRTKYNYLISKREQLEQEKRFLTEDINHIKKKSQKEVQKNRDLNRELEKSLAQIKLLEEYKEKYDNAHDDLRTLTKQVEQLGGKFKKLELENKALRGDLDMQNDQVEHYKNTISQLSQVQTKYTRLKIEAKNLGEDVDRYRELKENLEKKNKALVAKNKQNSMLLVSQETNLMELNQVKLKYDKLVPRMNKLQQSTNSLEYDIKQYQIENTNLKDRIKELKSVMASYKEAIDLLKATSEI